MKKILVTCIYIALTIFSSKAQKTESRLRPWFGMKILSDTTEAGWPVTLPGDTDIAINHYVLNPNTYEYHNVMLMGKQLITSPNTAYQLHIGYKSYRKGFTVTKKDFEKGWTWQAEGVYRRYYGSYTSFTPQQDSVYKKWHFVFKEPADTKYFPLAVLDNGELITSAADDINAHFVKEAPENSFLSFGVFKGLYAYDPVTKKTRTISADARFEPDPQKLPFRLTQDAAMLVSEERLPGLTRIQAYRLDNGIHYTIELPEGSALRLLGNSTAVVYDSREGGRLRMLSLTDGSELLQAPVDPASGFARDSRFRNIALHGDELYFLNLLNNTVGGLKPENGKMIAASVVPIDTTGRLVAEAGYYLGVARDYFTLVPGSIPPGYDSLKPYPLFAWCFSRTDGKPIFMLSPFYEQRKTEQEISKEQSDNCKKLYDNSPFRDGSHVQSASGEVLVWDILCSCNCYRVRSMTTYKYDASPGDYTATNKGLLARCPLCNGKGTYYSNVVVQDDSWKASGLGFYYSRSTDTKWVQQQGICPKCKGKGVVEE